MNAQGTNIQAMLEQLLASGKTYLEKGQDVAENALDIPETGSERDAKLDGLKKGALAAGGLALLLGTGSGRRLTGTALKLGSLAAIGGLAYKSYQNWAGKQGSDTDTPATPVHELTGSEAAARQALLLRAMIAAAKADGHIDNAEQAKIRAQIENIGLSQTERDFLQAEIAHPLEAQALAAEVNDKEIAAEVYLVSRIVIDMNNEAERDYLAELAKHLGLDSEEISSLESRAAA